MPLDTSFAALNRGFHVDAMQLEEFKMSMSDLARRFGPAFKTVHPTFGAYMRYSAVLEFGWRDRRSAKFRLQGGALVASTSGIPHIHPAIRNNIGFITKYLLDRVAIPALKDHFDTKGKSWPKTVKNLEKAWTSILNDKPRRDAVARAPYQYGFHRRSIQGSAYEIPAAKIAAMRAEAAAGYEREFNKRRAKRLAKKRGGRVLNSDDL